MEEQDKIDSFDGEYRFLSNFWPSRVLLKHDDGVKEYPSVEHAYQAAKTDDMREREYIRTLHSPTAAKHAGKKVILRKDWDRIKIEVMQKLVKLKFTLDHDLRDKLIATAPKELIEGNTWGDTYWGVCNGKGENMLGRVLMQLRDEMLEEVIQRGEKLRAEELSNEERLNAVLG